MVIWRRWAVMRLLSRWEETAEQGCDRRRIVPCAAGSQGLLLPLLLPGSHLTAPNVGFLSVNRACRPPG